MIQQGVHLRVKTCAREAPSGSSTRGILLSVACLLHRQVEDARLEEAEASAAEVKEVKPDLRKHGHNFGVFISSLSLGAL